MTIKRFTSVFLTIGCLILASCSSLGETIEVTRVVEVPVEVTRVVDNMVEVTSVVEVPVEKTVLVTQEMEVTREVEVTRIVEVPVEVTSTPAPTLPPTPTNTPRPAATAEPQGPNPSASAVLMDQSLRNMGGMIDAALRRGVLYCNEWVAEWDYFMSLPTTSPETQFAHDHINSWNDMTEGCRETLRTGEGGTIPFLQWGTIRQAINEALERIRPLVEG